MPDPDTTPDLRTPAVPEATPVPRPTLVPEAAPAPHSTPDLRTPPIPEATPVPRSTLVPEAAPAPHSTPDPRVTTVRNAAPGLSGTPTPCPTPDTSATPDDAPTPTAPASDARSPAHPGTPLTTLGLAEAPRDHPLTYPGAWPTTSALLLGDRLFPLDHLIHPARTPVLAVGSNASPAQLRHKMAEFGIASPVPMTKAKVTGLDVGVSAHISLMGYVSASPVESPGTVRELFVIWLDAEQLAVVDASEGATSPQGNYTRALLPASKARIELADGTPLPGASVYVNRHGVLHNGTGIPRAHPGQRPLIGELLDSSPALRNLFGTTPDEFCARARADARLCARGTALLRAEGFVTASGLEGLETLAPR